MTLHLSFLVINHCISLEYKVAIQLFAVVSLCTLVGNVSPLDVLSECSHKMLLCYILDYLSTR